MEDGSSIHLSSTVLRQKSRKDRAMSHLAWVLAELQRRIALLRDDIAARRLSADQNVNGDGIHQSQTFAVEELLADLLKRQDELFSALQLDQPPAEAGAT